MNRLNHFDMVFAVSEAAINSELKAMWNRWRYRSRTEDGVADPSAFAIELNPALGMRLEARLRRPSLTLLTGEDNGTQTAFFNLHLGQGIMAYRDFITMEAREVDLDGLTLSFKVNITKAHAARKELDRALREKIKGFPADEFSLSRLLIDVQNADFSSFVPSKTVVELLTNDPNGAANAMPVSAQIGAYLTQYFADKGTAFGLGFVIERKAAKAAKKLTFLPREYRLSIFEDEAAPTQSTLNHLIVTDKRAMPEPGAGAFDKSWLVEPDDDESMLPDHGAFVVSRDLFFDQFFIPKVAGRMGCSTRRETNRRWRLSRSDSGTGTTEKVYPLRATQSWSKTTSATISVSKGGSSIRLKGSATAKTQAICYFKPIKKSKEIGRKTIWVTFSFEKTFRVSVDPDTGEINFDPTATSVQRNEPGADSRGIFKITDTFQDIIAGFVNLFKKNTLKDSEDVEEMIGDALSSRLTASLRNVNLRRIGMVMLPGTKVLKFSGLRFTNHGDVQMTVNYQDASGGAVPVEQTEIAVTAADDATLVGAYRQQPASLRDQPVWHLAKDDASGRWIFCAGAQDGEMQWALSHQEPTQDLAPKTIVDLAIGATPWDAVWDDGIDVELS